MAFHGTLNKQLGKEWLQIALFPWIESAMALIPECHVFIYTLTTRGLLLQTLG